MNEKVAAGMSAGCGIFDQAAREAFMKKRQRKTTFDEAILGFIERWLAEGRADLVETFYWKMVAEHGGDAPKVVRLRQLIDWWKRLKGP